MPQPVRRDLVLTKLQDVVPDDWVTDTVSHRWAFPSMLPASLLKLEHSEMIHGQN